MIKNWKATKKFECYTYESLEDLKLHMLYMKQHGYSVWEFSETDLYAEYEMNDITMGGTKILEEGDEEFV